MIHVARTIIFSDQLAQKMDVATNKARTFFKDRATKTTQERHRFDNSLLQLIKPIFEEPFHNKCAYCESKVELGGGMIEHFRPKTEAIGLNGNSDPDWYWWLAYNWDNLLLACKTCNDNKRNHFPVVGDRAPLEATGTVLDAERALLLNPCVDRPEKYLQFQEDGSVRSIAYLDKKEQARFKGYDRGEKTIQLLGLNRPTLIEARLDAVSKVTQPLYDFLEAPEEVLKQVSSISRGTLLMSNVMSNVSMAIFYDAAQPFAAARRQVLAQFIQWEKVRPPRFNPAGMKLLANLRGELSEELAPEFFVLEQLAKPVAKTVTVAKAPITHPTPTSHEAAYLQKIDIRNFRAIQDMSLQFTEAPKTGVSWKMLLGENGAGKSTVLRAVALALMGKAAYKKDGERMRLAPARIFNRKTKQKDGLIRIELSKGVVEIHFDKKDLQFVSGGEPINLFMRGYGATRLLSSNDLKGKQSRAQDIRNVDNLFDHFAPLCAVEDWMLSLNQDQFNSAGLTLKDLLHLEDVKKSLSKKGKRVYLDVGYGPLPLEEQSDGYQSVLALACDIMAGVPGALHDKQQASGIVLLDEIDAHLHPRWKMKIVSRLRACFPNIQFLVTTHEPLCLKGLEEKEIALMQREGDQLIVRDDIPSPVGLRVDQLLTSQLFGLYSTIDPDVDAQFQEYYELLAAYHRSPQQEQRLLTLKNQLQRYNKLGYTRRDQLVYEVIDEYLACEGKITNLEDRAKLRRETKQRVAEIWMSIRAQREAEQ